MSFIVIRRKGDAEPCDSCGQDVEIFSRESAEARFLIIRLADRPSLGGGRCLECRKSICISCATQTVYGKGMRRLHCPECGSFLAGLRRDAGSQEAMGAFLEEPPEFSGRKPEAGSEPIR